MAKTYHAAMIVIGNEILSGRTQDKNINYLALKLNDAGVQLREVRVIPDVEQTIIECVNEMRARYDYVFTSGGIGPTHDDITAESVSKAFDVPWGIDDRAYQILLDYYGEEAFSDARKKMAMIPEGADLIPNPVSSAPGFQVENVYVLAGVPTVFQSMVDYIALDLKGGDIVHSRTVSSPHPESVMASQLGEIQARYADVDIGSYPHFRTGSWAVNIVLRSVDEALLDAAEKEVAEMVKRLEKP